MPLPYSAEKHHVHFAIVRAAALCRQVQTETVEPFSAEKADRSPVTVADYASQAIICQRLADAFPNDPVVAEETSQGLRSPDQADMLDQVTQYVREYLPGATSEDVCGWIDYGGVAPGHRFWTLDPIDGTKGFLRGEQYAVALALIVDGQVQLGALACPNLPLDLSEPEGPCGVLFLAVRGQGVRMSLLPTEVSPKDLAPVAERGPSLEENYRLSHAAGGSARPISVASLDDASAARFVESVEPGHTNHAAHEALARALGITQASVRLDSQAKYGAVARGDAAVYLRLPSFKSPHYREKIWDHAAGALIIEEAGGRVTDAQGVDLDFGQGRRLEENRGIVASNGRLHPAILRAIRV
jgi:3'(2'), 5'-bisphosphate nucleotidase